MRLDLEHFCSSFLADDFAVAAFKKKGILIYSEGSMSLLSSLQQTQDKLEFSGNLKINLSPAIQPNATVDRITVSEDCSRVVLIGKRSIHLVLILPEIISLRGSKKEYFCECSVISGAWMQNRRTVVLMERWLPSNGIFHNHIAFLFSDSCIRIYALDRDDYSDCITIDFSPFLSTDKTSSNRFGLFKNLVSFDFVGCENGHPSLIAIDSEGDMYAAFITGDDSFSVRPLISPPSLPCNPVSIMTVPHPFQEVFAVLAIFNPSQNGIITHVIAVPTESGGFDLTVQERLNLPTPARYVCLLSSDRDCSYLVGTSDRLYFMDIRPWIISYGQILVGSSPSCASLPDSRLHSLIVALSEKNDRMTAFLGQTAVVSCASDTGEQVSVFATRFSQPRIAISCLRWDMLPSCSNDSATASLEPSFKETVLDPILSKKHILPSVRGSPNISELETLNEMDQWSTNFMHNMGLTRDAYKAALVSLSEVPYKIDECKSRRDAVNQRVLSLLDSFSGMKDRVQQQHSSLVTLLARIDSLANRLAGKVPLSSQESKMLSSLKEYRRQIVTYSIKLPQLSIGVAEANRAMSGPARSFQPSGSAVTATINRTGCEVDALRNRMDRLADTLDELTPNESVA